MAPRESSSWLGAAGPSAGARRVSDAAGPGSSASFGTSTSRSTSGEALGRRRASLRAPAAAAAQQRPEAQRAHRPRPPPRRGEQPVDQQPEGALELLPRGGLRQLQHLDQLLVAPSRPGRVVAPAGERPRPQAERAEAVGDVAGTQRGERAEVAQPEPLERPDQPPGGLLVGSEAIGEDRDREGGEEAAQPLGGDDRLAPDDEGVLAPASPRVR